MSAERIIFALGALGGAMLVAIVALLIDHALGMPADAAHFGAGLGAGCFLGWQFKDWRKAAQR